MNRPEIYEQTVNILLDAYNHGVLRHTHCQACAVGNIVRATHYKNKQGRVPMQWFNERIGCDLETYKYLGNNHVDEIKSTGYTPSEINKIENAFEYKGYHSYGLMDKKEGQYIGLIHVLNELKRIHGVNEPKHVENKVRLKEVYDLVTV